MPVQLEAINARCRENGIPQPISFAWPGNAFQTNALPLLRAAGIHFARRGGEPEVPYKEGGGIAYEPGVDHPLLIPTTGDARPDWTLEDLKRAVAKARNGRIAVLQFHGVPDGEHPWVNTPRERFEAYMVWLHHEGFKVIALRDLAAYVDEKKLPANPLDIMEQRRKARAAAKDAAANQWTRQPSGIDQLHETVRRGNGGQQQGIKLGPLFGLSGWRIPAGASPVLRSPSVRAQREGNH